VFSPDNVSIVQNDDSDTMKNTQSPPVERLHMSNLDSSVDESMDQTEPW